MHLPVAETEIVVPFHDIDLLEVVWHGHYLRYLEVARGALLDLIDYNYPQMRASGYAWPVIEVKLRYPRPARYGQRLRVQARMTEFDPRLCIEYLITDAATGERLTKGRTVQVAVEIATGEMQFGSVEPLVRRLREAACIA